MVYSGFYSSQKFLFLEYWGARVLPFPVYVAKVEMRAAKMGINVGLFLCFSIAIDLDPDTHIYTHTLHSTK